MNSFLDPAAAQLYEETLHPRSCMDNRIGHPDVPRIMRTLLLLCDARMERYSQDELGGYVRKWEHAARWLHTCG
jgi:hypothetical protein